MLLEISYLKTTAKPTFILSPITHTHTVCSLFSSAPSGGHSNPPGLLKITEAPRVPVYACFISTMFDKAEKIFKCINSFKNNDNKPVKL